MNDVLASHAADVVENIVNVGGPKPELSCDPLGHVFVLHDERDRDVDLKSAAIEQHEQPIGCAPAGAQSGNEHVGVDDNLPDHVGIIYDTILSVKSSSKMQ